MSNWKKVVGRDGVPAIRGRVGLRLLLCEVVRYPGYFTTEATEIAEVFTTKELTNDFGNFAK